MIVKPKLFLLTIFGLVALIPMLLIFYALSLPFFNMVEIEVIKYLWFPVALFTLISVFIDSKYKTKFIRYAFTLMISLVLAHLIFPPIKKHIIKNTEAKGELLVTAIQNYKLKHGFYPKSLDDPYFKDSPKKAILNRHFFYKLHQNNKKDTFFSISCNSFDGYLAERYFGDGEWKYFD